MISESARACIRRRKDYIPGKPVEEVQRELGLTDIIKMASNENPFGASPKALEAIIREMQENANRYPESLCTELAEKVAARLGVKPGNLFFDNGGDGVITMIGLTFINPGDEVIFSELTFPAYDNITTKMDGRSVVVPLTAEGDMDLDGFAAAITDKTKLIFICNPNNPTGKIVPADKLKAFLAKVPKTVAVVLDEAYYDFVESPDYPDSVSLLGEYDNIIILRTFSKVMGLAALRCGYVIAAEDCVKIMLKAREPFPVNRAAQAGALASLEDNEFYDKTVSNNAAGRRQFYEGFRALGLPYYESQTNFIYVELGADAETVFQTMLRDGVIVRPLTSQGRPQAMRISVGLPDENARTLASLKKALGK